MKHLSAVTARHIYSVFGMNNKPEEGFEFDTGFLKEHACEQFENMKDTLIAELPKRVLPSAWSRQNGHYKFTEKGCLKLLKHVLIIQKESFEIQKQGIIKPLPGIKRTKYVLIRKKIIGNLDSPNIHNS